MVLILNVSAARFIRLALPANSQFSSKLLRIFPRERIQQWNWSKCRHRRQRQETFWYLMEQTTGNAVISSQKFCRAKLIFAMWVCLGDSGRKRGLIKLEPTDIRYGCKVGNITYYENFRAFMMKKLWKDDTMMWKIIHMKEHKSFSINARNQRESDLPRIRRWRKAI